jgi:hypothetical protein
MTTHTFNAPERRYILERLNMATVAACADSMTVPLLEKTTTELREALDFFERHLTIAKRLSAASAATPQPQR